MKKAIIVGMLLLAGCKSICGPRCHTNGLKEQKEAACKRARTRAVVALYKLRSDAPSDVQADGVSQALELDEWSTYCDHTLPLAGGTKPDIDALRQMLTHLVRAE